MPKILEQPIKRQGRRYDPPPVLDEFAQLLRSSDPGTQVAGDEIYPSRQQAQVRAATYRYWLERVHGLKTKTATATDPSGREGFIFSLELSAD